jgi:hypothetical protein
MTLQEIEHRLDRYHLCANACESGRHRTAYMLAMMMCCAAAIGEIITMPDDWGWPQTSPLPGVDDSPGTRDEHG